MELPVNFAWLAAFLLAFARSIGWLLNVPPFSNRSVIPPVCTVAVASGIAMMVSPALPVSSIPTTFDGLVGALVFQLMSGIALGFVVNVLLSTVTAAGGMVDLFGGLNLPSAVDPLSLEQTPMLGQFYEQVMVVLLFLSGGYLYMLQGFARSFSTGYSLGASNRVALVLVNELSTFFVSALEIAAPILAVLFMTQVVLGMLTRAAPQMNVWIMGMPLQIFLSLTLVAIAVGSLPDYIGNIVGRAIGDTASLFGGK